MSHTNTPNNPTPGQGTTPTHAIPLSPDEEEEEEVVEEDDEPFSVFQVFDSESEGGMQIDPPNPNPNPPFEFAGSELAHEAQEWEEQRDGVFPSSSFLSPLDLPQKR